MREKGGGRKRQSVCEREGRERERERETERDEEVARVCFRDIIESAKDKIMEETERQT